MAETLPDTDTFTATIQMPTSGEVVSAADLRDKAVQSLSNRTYYNKQRIDEREPECAMYTISGTSVAYEDNFTLTESINNSGFSQSSGQITFPSTGLYLVHISGIATNSSTSNPTTVGIEAVLASGSFPNDRVYAAAERFSATASLSVPFAGSRMFDITDTGADLLDVNPIALSGETTTLLNFCQISLVRIRET